MKVNSLANVFVFDAGFNAAAHVAHTFERDLLVIDLANALLELTRHVCA